MKTPEANYAINNDMEEAVLVPAEVLEIRELAAAAEFTPPRYFEVGKETRIRKDGGAADKRKAKSIEHHKRNKYSLKFLAEQAFDEVVTQ